MALAASAALPSGRSVRWFEAWSCFLLEIWLQGIQCNYITINGIGNVMSEVSKVLLSASAVHANGSVLARAGTSMISMMARSFNKPVMILCESYKFHERVQCDSFTYNELGNPEKLISKNSNLKGYQNDKLLLCNLVYDVTPREFVSLIVTEFGLVPPTSIPVILRECRNDLGV